MSAGSSRVTTDGLRRLEDSLCCSICTDVLKDPRTLIPCLHTFCEGCLSWYLESNNGRELECPLCRREFYKPAEGVHGVPVAFLQRDLLDTYNELAREHKSRSETKCKYHEQEISHACLTCKLLVCTVCRALMHRDHEAKPLNSVWEDCHSKVVNVRKQVSGKRALCQSLLEDMEAANTEVKKQKLEATEKLKTQEARLIQAIQNHTKSLTERILQKTDETERDIEASIVSLKVERGHFAHCAMQLDKCLKEGNKLGIIKTAMEDADNISHSLAAAERHPVPRFGIQVDYPENFERDLDATYGIEFSPKKDKRTPKTGRQPAQIYLPTRSGMYPIATVFNYSK